MTETIVRKILDENPYNTSSVIIVNHLKKETITKVEEVKKHTIISFISDVGGILGVFLGLSIWSFYENILVLSKYVEKKLSNNTVKSFK